MSLSICEKQSKLEVMNTANNLDGKLCKNLIDPLPNYSGFMWLISGASGSGKTTLLTSLMSQKSKKGEPKRSYRECFNRILICSPTLGNGTSLKKDPFADIPEDQIWKEFNHQTMSEIMETINDNHDEEENTVLILDDIGAMLRKDSKAEKMLVSLGQNRRHVNCSIFILVQKFKDMPTGIRNNCSHFITFRPKNNMEIESIMGEMSPFNKKHWQHIINYVFDNDDKHSFLMIDMSLKKTNKFLFYNKFNQMFIDDDENDIHN